MESAGKGAAIYVEGRSRAMIVWNKINERASLVIFFFGGRGRGSKFDESGLKSGYT